MSQSTREVIQEWADGEGGYTFERGRMEAAVRLLCFKEPVSLHKDASSSTKVSQKPNKDDVEFLTKELGILKSKAEEVLNSCQGDLTKALIELMSPHSK